MGSMAFFLYIVYELLVGLKAAIESETDPVVKGKIELACLMTVVSWCTYPVVYLLPMLGISAANAVVSIQLGNCYAGKDDERLSADGSFDQALWQFGSSAASA